MKTILSILFLFLAGAASMADTTEHDAEFFHPAASLYIQGDTVASSNLVAKGLSLYPEDGKLLRLKELLEKQQEQEKEQQQKNKEQQQKNQEQQQNKQEQQQNEKQQNQKENEEPQNEENQKPPESNEAQQQPSEQMTEDEAKQLLDAMKQEEQNKRMQLHPVLGAPVKVDKDW